MLLAEAGCVFVAVLLYISGFVGQAKNICALKSSSVDLPCSAKYPTSSKKWVTVAWNGYDFILTDLSVERNHVTYDMSKESPSTLTINDLRESDAKTYSCRATTDHSEHDEFTETVLHVTDLQVKVIPVTATEDQRVTLMCSTSCPLTENTTTYIWYKNGEFLYQDWSPWYQHLVSSEEAIRYSCAVKGYEHLRAPEVSVDSVTSTCFSVTYTEGRMCSSEQPCSITYPRELHVQRTPVTRGGENVRLTCSTSCTLIDKKQNYTWFKNGNVPRTNDQFSVTRSSVHSHSCAVEGHEDLRSPAVCGEETNCWSVNYVSRRICALEGSTVDIYSHYSYPSGQRSKPKVEFVMRKTYDEFHITDESRMEYHEKMENQLILRIKNLTQSDSADYIVRFPVRYREQQCSGFPGVTLIVTALKVQVTPAEVTEGQRVTLTCGTSCPLADNTTYIWYHNRRALTSPESQHKQLILDPVSRQHEGSYSCAVKAQQHINSPEETLTVRVISLSIMNVVRLSLAFLGLIAVSLSCWWMRRKKTLTSTTEPNNLVQTEQPTDSEYVNLSAMELQEDSV